MKKILRSQAVQSLLASLLCVVVGMLAGYIVLLFINPEGAGKGNVLGSGRCNYGRVRMVS